MRSTTRGRRRARRPRSACGSSRRTANSKQQTAGVTNAFSPAFRCPPSAVRRDRTLQQPVLPHLAPERCARDSEGSCCFFAAPPVRFEREADAIGVARNFLGAECEHVADAVEPEVFIGFERRN